MKKIIFIALLIILYIASGYAQTVINLGHGTFPGFKPFSNTKYITDGGVVNFTSGFDLTGVSNTTFDGTGNIGQKYSFVYAGTATPIISRGGAINDVFKGFDFGRTVSKIVDGNYKPQIVYNGTQATTLFWGLNISDSKWGGKTSLYSGCFDAPTTYMDLCVAPIFERNIVTNDSTRDAIQVFGCSIYLGRFNDWNITGRTLPNGDDGVFFIPGGNAQATNIYRNNGKGYLYRAWPVALGGLSADQSILVENCIDVYTSLYGTLDIQMHADILNSTAAIPLLGVDGYFLNNTSAHKVDANNGYVTNAVIHGDMADETGKVFSLHMKNNLAYDAWVSGSSGGSSLYKHNCSKCILDSSNNYDLAPGKPLSAGLLVDQVNFQPVPGGLLDRRGVGAQIIVPNCPIVHDTTMVLEPVDSAQIIADWVGAHPCPVCPICPVIPPQRIAIFISIYSNVATIMYNDGTVTNLPLKNSILIQ